MNHTALTFAVVLAALYAAHSVADHWVQTNKQAVAKGGGGRAGGLACLRHVLTHTATLAAVLAVTSWRTGLDLNTAHVAIALAFNGATHWFIDLRWPIQRAARAIGKGSWLDHDPTAAYQLDQAAHVGLLFVTALIAA